MNKRYSNNSNEKSIRNREIYDGRVGGKMVAELSAEYNLSIPRIHRIVMQEENKVLKEKLSIKEKELSTCIADISIIKKKK